jgi:glycosyltransferase involved in cell wall biosynthesis
MARVTLVSRLFRPEPGAAAYQLGALADELRARGHRVTVLTTIPPGDARTDDAGADVRRWPVLRDKGGNVRGYVQYLSYDIPLFFRLLFTRSDVVVVQPPPTTGFVSRVACALSRTPYVHFSDDVVSTAAEGIGVNRAVVRVLKALERWVVNGAREVLAISDGVRDDLVRLGVRRELVRIVGVGVDTDLFAYAEREPAKTLVYGGTMSEIHGAGVFVRAFAKVAAKHPDARLLMIGQGTHVPALREAAERLAPGRVEFRGLRPAEELRREFSSAAAALASLDPGSGYEYAFATKALAGLCAGAPVIYAGVGPLAAIVAEHDLGWAVGWDDDAVAAAMDQALAEHPTPERRRALSAWVLENHSLRSVAARAVDVIDRVR